MTAQGAQQAWIWSKLASAKWEDAWVERLQCIDPQRLAIFTLPGSRRIRIEAYGLTAKESAQLVKNFGGQTRRMKGLATLMADPKAKPLLIRDRLVVVRSAKAAKSAARQYPSRSMLIIPAAMAFGTGDHATTSACLRLVSDFAAGAGPGKWENLDLGTGTGILAFAARVLGAARCDAWDFDPACIRAVKENARLNQIRGVIPARVDVTEWTPARQWDLVTANLYSDMLLKVSARIASAVKPGGRLILSGMLATQSEETLAAFRTRGIKFQRTIKRGKWVTALGAA